MDVRSFLTTWGFEIEHEKLDKMEHQLEGIKHTLEFLGAVEIVKGLFELAHKFTDVASQTHNAALAAGITVEEYQKLAYAANQADVSQEEMGQSLTRLSRKLYSARTGSTEAMQAFTKIGFSGEQVRGFKNSSEAMQALSDKIKNMKDPMARVGVLQDILGRGSQRMIGLLSQGSEAMREKMQRALALGAVMTEHQIESLRELEDSVKDVNAMFKGFAGYIAATVAPVFKALIDDFMKFFLANRAILEQNFENWFIGLAYWLGVTWEVIKLLTEALIDFAKAFGFENDILKITMALVGLVLGIFAISTVVGMATAVLGPFIAVLGFLFSAIMAVDAALTWAAAAIWAIDAPLLAIVGTALVLIILLDALFAAITGRKMFLQTFVEWLGKLDAVREALGWISDTWAKLTGGSMSADMTMKTDRLGGISRSPGSMFSEGPAAGGDNHFNIDAPMNFTVPPGTNPADVGQHVEKAVGDHFNWLMRQTSIDTRPGVAH